MTIILTHNQQALWVESNILSNLLDVDGNSKTLKDILSEVTEYAIRRTIEKTGCKAGRVRQEDEYKNTFGWMGEVLCEFWLRTFGHRLDLCNICDTSYNQFQ